MSEPLNLNISLETRMKLKGVKSVKFRVWQVKTVLVWLKNKPSCVGVQ